MWSKEYRKIYNKKYYEANKEEITIRGKKRHKANKEKEAIRWKKYYEINKKKILEQMKKNRKTNPEKAKTKDKQSYNKQKLKFGFFLNSNMSKGIRYSLKNGNGKNGKHWETLVPYNLNNLIKRLKKTLPKDYKWKDYINGKTDLHIDHIIPIAVHNFKSHTDTDFQRCWALKNLRLLPALKNISKGAKLKKPFQPSLLL